MNMEWNIAHEIEKIKRRKLIKEKVGVNTLELWKTDRREKSWGDDVSEAMDTRYMEENLSAKAETIWDWVKRAGDTTNSLSAWFTKCKWTSPKKFK